MKRISTLFLCILFSAMSFAGGLLTNSNQSTQYIRTLSRNASTGVDATYFNPAGLSKLENGFYLTIDNQSIFQTKTITNDFSLLNSSEFVGKVSAPLFPTGFAVYKMDQLALSFGFGPNAGGGSAKFDKGLPSFEIEIAKNIPALSALSKLGKPVEAYAADINFEGSSIFWGFQLGATYKVNDMISVFAGVRYLPAKNTYTGYLRNIQLGPKGGLQNAQKYIGDAATIATDSSGKLTALSTYYSNLSNQLSAAAASVQPFISNGAGTLTIAQAQGMGLINATQVAQLQGGLGQLGLTADQINAMNFTQIQGTFSNGATLTASGSKQASDGAAYLTGVSTNLTATAGMFGDKEVDVTQTGTGFTPILGLDITPIENLNIGIKYEFLTKLELTNKTAKDGTGKFPDGAVTKSDIPAILSAGAEYKMGKLSTSLSYTQYFDKQANWGGREKLIDHGLWEIGLGLEYKISDKFLVSIGGNHTETGVQPAYQTDLSYSNSSNTVGLGCQIGLTKKIDLNLGVLNTFYVKNQKEYLLEGFTDKITETYQKTTMVLSLGLDFKLF
jgi:long-chain fatty acid transport protein